MMVPGAASAQVGELVRALALAWKNLAAYPSGHPVLAASLALAQQRAAELRGPAGEVVLGVASDGIMYGEEKIESLYAQKFGHALFGRGVAIVRFDTAASARDIETFLRLLGVGVRPGEQRPIWEELTAAGVVHILLQPVDYSAVRVTDTLDTPAPPKKAESLWDEILRALLAGRELSAEAGAAMTSKVQTIDDLSAMILRYVNSDDLPQKTFDPDATFGVRLTRGGSADQTSARVTDAIGGYIANSSGLKRQLAVQQVMQLLRTLPEPLRGAILRAVLRTLATDEKAGSLLRDVASVMPDDAVLEALRYLSSMSNLSSHAMTLMQSLSSAHRGGTELQWAPPTLVADLVHLFAEDDIDRFNPEDHRQLLTEITVHVPPVAPAPESAQARLGDRMASISEAAATRMMAATLLELLARNPANAAAAKPRIEAIFRAFISGHHYEDATELVDGLQTVILQIDAVEARQPLEALLGELASIDNIQALIGTLLDAKPGAAPAIQRLIERLGVAATRTLIMALAEENNRSRRRKLFDFVCSLGPQIVPEVTRFLDDDRWFVVRNMIVLLRAVNDRTSFPRIQELARHKDLRVRLEAIKTLLTMDSGVSRTLLENAINDPDPKLAETAIALVGSYGIREGVAPLLKILKGRDIFGTRRMIRLRALKALGELGDPSALEGLRGQLKDSILPWPTKEERRAAYQSLAGYPMDAREPMVQRGLRSRDSVIREICRTLAPPPEPSGEAAEAV